MSRPISCWARAYQLHPSRPSCRSAPVSVPIHVGHRRARRYLAVATMSSFQYRFRLDHDNLELRRSRSRRSRWGRVRSTSISAILSTTNWRRTVPFNAREQLSPRPCPPSSRIIGRAQVYTIQNLGEQAGPLQSGVSLTYDDDCFTSDRRCRQPPYDLGRVFGRPLFNSAHRLQDAWANFLWICSKP